MTPSGIEAGRNVTGSRSVTVSPTEPGALQRPAATLECNECNEALDAAREKISRARQLALVAGNAVVNGDLPHARAVLCEVVEVLSGLDVRLAASPRVLISR